MGTDVPDSVGVGQAPAFGWSGGVLPALGAGPRRRAVVVASDLPAGCVFADVVAFAGRVQLVGRGGPVGERDDVVEVADPGGAVAGAGARFSTRASYSPSSPAART
jgi:hypothetical protein